MKKYLVAILLSLSFAVVNAQNSGTLVFVPNSGPVNIIETVNMRSALGTINLDPFAVYDIDGNKKGFNYADIGGSPFLIDDWRLAIIYDVNLKKIAVVKIRFNTYSNQIHYLDNKDQELIADKGALKKIDILKADDKEVELILEKGFTSEKNKLANDQFLEVLNTGSVKLLKQITNKIVEKDSLVGTAKVIKFSSSVSYYLNKENSCERLRKLDQSEIFALLTNKDVVAEYEKNNKQKLRKEKDVIEFLNYYNSHNH